MLDTARLSLDPPVQDALAAAAPARPAGRQRRITRYGFTVAEARLFQALQQAGIGQSVSFERLWLARCGGHSDKPRPPQSLRTLVCRMRRKLAGSGWRIENVVGGGYRLERSLPPGATSPWPAGELFRRMGGNGLFGRSDVAVLEDWRQHPQRYRLPAPLLALLRRAAAPDATRRRVEREAGLPDRSLPTVLRVIAACLREPAPRIARPAAPAEDAREELDWIAAATPPDWLPWVERYRLTHLQARLFQVLHRVGVGRLATRERLWRALYADRPDDVPDIDIITCLVCHIRARLAGSGWRIATVWGEGYRLEHLQGESAPVATGGAGKVVVTG